MQATPELYNLHIGDNAPPFTLQATDGKSYTLESFKEKPILVVVFMCNHCPYVLATIERIQKLATEFADKGVQFVGINANDPQAYPQDSFENMQRFAQQRSLSFPYLYDETQETARAYHGLLTPHVMLFDQQRKLVYNGGIDDNIQDEDVATEHWLHDALTALTNNQVPAKQETPCVGCSIKWRE